MAGDFELRVELPQFVGDFIGVVGRAVIDHQDFKAGAEIRKDVQELVDLPGESVLGVIDRENDAE